MAGSKYSARRGWTILCREPLVLFVILGVALYGAWTVFSPHEKTTMRIEASELRALEEAREELLGRPLTVEEREGTRQSYIDDEVLLREALGRGLQWSDSRVRSRLVQMMRGSLAERVADPSVAQLQAYFRENIDRFTVDESVTLEQIIFPWGEEVSEEKIAEILGALRSGAAPKRYGASAQIVPQRLRRATRSTLIQTYGLGPQFADAVGKLPAHGWQGPVESLRGVHLVRIEEHHPSEPATFEEIEGYLRQDWVFAREREIQQERIAEIREKYRIEMAGE